MSESTRVQTSGSPAPLPRLLVVGVFDDEALHVWRRANPRLGVGPIAMVGRTASGATNSRTRGVLTPRRGAAWGAVIGVIVHALPAAGAAGLVGWLVGTLAFGLTGLVGATPGNQSGMLAVIAGGGSAFTAAVLLGVVGAVLGGLVGLVVGLIDTAARGMGRTETAATLAALDPGSWATMARAAPPASSLVRQELARLGGAPTYEWLPIQQAPAAPAPPVAAAPPPVAAVPEPSAPATAVEEPGTAAEEPGTAAGEPGAALEEPQTAAPEPGAALEEPKTAAEEPATAAGEPGAALEGPKAGSEEPGAAAGDAGTAVDEKGRGSQDAGTGRSIPASRKR